MLGTSSSLLFAGNSPYRLPTATANIIRNSGRPRRTQSVVVAVAKPPGASNGRNDKKTGKVTPASKASPKKKLPEVSADPEVRAAKTQAQAEQQVDDTASTAKQQVGDAARAAKDTARDFEASTPDQRRAINRQADRLEDNIDEGADAVKDAVDSGREAAQDLQQQATRTASQLEDQIDEGSEQLQEGIEEGRRRLDNAIDQAPEQISGAVQQAVDATADGINSARSQIEELQKPGPKARYQYTPLTSLSPAPFEGRPGPKASDTTQADYYKKRLFYAVAGLDRGVAANSSAQAEVEANVSSLLSVSSPVLLSWAPEEGQAQSTLSQLNGVWRLIYSSAFAKGNAPSLPGYKLGQVYQGISAYASRLDNIVELYSTVKIPQLPGFPSIDPVVTTATLKHFFEAIGGSSVSIRFEDTEVKSTGGPNGILGRLPEFTLPKLPENLRPSSQVRSSTFEVLFLDEDSYITRGARGELRIFVRT